jgi:hypothetical protein
MNEDVKINTVHIVSSILVPAARRRTLPTADGGCMMQQLVRMQQLAKLP